MKLTSQQRQQVRLSILRHLATSTLYGMATDLLLQHVRNEGFRSLEKSQMEDEIQHLFGLSFVEQLPNPVSPENKIWRITRDGIAFQAKRNE